MAKGKPVPPALNDDLSQLQASWGIDVDAALLERAVNHRSYAYEQDGVEHNERLEFLGDSVLAITVTQWLYRHFPQLPESKLSSMRGAIVSQPSLAQAARNVQLGQFLRLGKGENLSGGREKDSILCDAFEALIGATFLTHGFEPTVNVVVRHMLPFLRQAQAMGRAADYKTTLQELCNLHQLPNPEYSEVASGPDHDRRFTATVRIGQRALGTGVDSVKRHAQAKAAKVAWETLTAELSDA